MSFVYYLLQHDNIYLFVLVISMDTNSSYFIIAIPDVLNDDKDND